MSSFGDWRISFKILTIILVLALVSVALSWIGVVDVMASAATEMRATAQTMTGIADRTSKQSLAAASATGQAVANVQTVASAPEELSASIREIAAQAQYTDAIVQGLAASAGEAGHAAAQVLTASSELASQADRLKTEVVRFLTQVRSA